MKTEEDNPRHWFFLAAERLKAADVLYAQEGSTLSGIELLQEAVERYLKGFLIAHSWVLQKIHDLTVLNEEAKRVDARFALFDDMCENLTEQYWAQHYPGADLSTVGSDYDELRKSVGELVVLIESILPRYFEA